jgi:REP element-mobilizing transposase RayT
MEQQTQWQWQEEGSSWKGIGIYHLTLTIPSREPLLGALVVPDNDPTQARVERTELGSALLDCQRSVSVFHPEIQILQYCLMPDHLHTVWYVRQPMEHSIRYVAQGFWRAAKKAGRAFSYLNAQPRLTGGATDERAVLPLSSLSPADSRETPLRTLLGADAYYRLEPLFTEVPFIRPMSRRGQLQAMIRYVQLNPQRLATKRMMPGFFRVQEGIVIAGRTYSGVGNISLLQAEHYATVHVRHDLVDEAVQGKPQCLRNYMNGCVLAARHGVVMVSPFISPHEKAVMAVLLNEQHSFILLADNGFRDYYKPSDNIFDAVAAGRALVLSPWAYDAGKRHITRADCVALNGMAEEIASM